MKKIFLIALIICHFSFSTNEKPPFEISSIKKNFVKIKDDLLVSKYEVSNLDYHIFLNDLKENNQAETYNSCLPDTMAWKEKIQSANPFVNYYFQSASFDNYPVVGISYDAANKYCKWISNKYNQDEKRKYKKVRFKLLTKEEWIFAASKGDASKTYTWGSGFMQNNRKQDLCNYKHTQFIYDSLSKKYNEIPENRNTALHGTLIAANVNAYYPNSFGLYNMCGNAAEMIEEKGIAKGGSYDDPAYAVRIASEKMYSKPQADIGFRVAMKIVEE